MAQEECAITKDYEKSLIEFNRYKGEFSAVRSRLEKQEHANQSLALNSTFVNLERMNSFAKLPDIDVHQFDDEIANYTKCQSLFETLIHTNDSLKPQQKLFFL